MNFDKNNEKCTQQAFLCLSDDLKQEVYFKSLSHALNIFFFYIIKLIVNILTLALFNKFKL